jgi:hypothetical protein
MPSGVALSSSTRLRGLDTLRALAITLIFAFHYQVFVSHESTFIVSSPDRLEETVQHLQVVTDGEVATVSFDDEFWSNSTMQNRGLECWHLVRSGLGGKSPSWCIRLNERQAGADATAVNECPSPPRLAAYIAASA